MNNIQYISLFDTAINTFLIRNKLLCPTTSETVAFCISSTCQYNAAVAFPSLLTVGVRVGSLGKTSVNWECAVFDEDEETSAAAKGSFVHVFVDRQSKKKRPIPDNVREELEKLVVR